MTDTGDGGGLAARLRDVVFSYDRDDSLELTDEGDVDPDAREGAVLRGVDLDVPEGEVVVLMGASGGGKSTLLRTLNAIIPSFIRGSFAGDIDVLGRDATATKTTDLASDVGMVLQDYEAQLFGTSVAREVAFGPENFGVSPAEIDDRIERSLAFAGLEDLGLEREPAGLSGGQKQRLVFASVLAMHPNLLVLDEPTSDLDPKGTREVLEIVSDLAGSEPPEEFAVPGADWDGPDTIVIVTHKIEEAVLADRAVLLKDGTVFENGPAEDVFTDADTLREARIAVPPIVEIFDRVGFPRDDVPITVPDAVDEVRDAPVSWTPLGEETLHRSPAGTGGDEGDVVFELDDVVYEYDTDQGPIRAVDGVSLDVREGEVVAIVGHNGSGKTTLAKHFNGLFDPDSGTARWRGNDLSALSMSEIGQHVGYVFQNPDHQIFENSVRDEVAFGPENFGIEGEELDRRVSEAIEAVELGPLEDADPFNLSKGQRQRVALASILATDPDVIVFDEPTTGLDAEQQKAFMDLVARLNREENLTVVMVTHDMASVAAYAPRTVVLENGRKAADLPTRRLFADSDQLREWGLNEPQVVELSNALAPDPEALPALSVPEAVEAFGGDGAYGGDSL